jgi:flagellar biosynthesis protein FlhA
MAIRSDHWKDLVLPAAVLAALTVVLLPLPGGLIDLLLSFNLLLSLLVLLTAIQVRTPLEFSVLPTILLATTLFRLVLNIATTRLILTQGGELGLDAAGQVVRSFGQFVTGDNLLVGIVLFGIIAVVQFVVITKGATRISEVAARFSLDALPGRQLAIDADLSAGVIKQDEAQRRRDELTLQADFFGAMDGAGKFIRGDAIAGVLITLVNILGGWLVGTLQSGMTLAEATEVFTKLTIGDGLVSQVPALLISLGAGILTTRSSKKTDLSREFFGQLFAQPRIVGLAGVILLMLTITHLPKLPLMLLGGSCLGAAVLLSRPKPPVHEANRKSPSTRPARPSAPRIEDYLAVDPVEIELGVGLVRLADGSHGGQLLEQVQAVRKRMASDLGIVLPKVRVRDNLQLADHQYRIKLAGNPVAEGSLPPHELAALLVNVPKEIPAERHLQQPGFPSPVGIFPAQCLAEFRARGIPLLSPTEVISRHLQQVVRLHAHELLTRDATRHLLEELKKSAPAVVEELVPGGMRIGEIQKTLQGLLSEDVPIRQLGLILETLGDDSQPGLTAAERIERVRRRLARTLSTRYCDASHRLHVVTLSPELERGLGCLDENQLSQGDHDSWGERLRLGLQPYLTKLHEAGHPAVLLVHGRIRRISKLLTSRHFPHLAVLSNAEITPETKVISVGIVLHRTGTNEG